MTSGVGGSDGRVSFRPEFKNGQFGLPRVEKKRILLLEFLQECS